MKIDLHHLTWPESALCQAITSIARKSKLPTKDICPSDMTMGPNTDRNDIVEAIAQAVGIEAEPIQTSYADIELVVQKAGPALISLPGKIPREYLCVLKSRGNSNRVSILAPDLSICSLRRETIRDAFRQNLESSQIAGIDALLSRAGVSRRRWKSARAAILRERLGQVQASEGWILRPHPCSAFRHQLRHAGAIHDLYVLTGSYTLHYVLVLSAWWVLGKAVLSDRLDRGWLMAWALLLLTAIPFRILAIRSQGLFATKAGSLLKQRLLYGAMRLDPEEVRRQGSSQLMGKVIDSTAVESLALSGGFLGVVAVIELFVSMLVLGACAGGMLLVLLLAGWIILSLLLGWMYLHTRHRWTGTRLAMTNDLIEQMVGDRTRLAQQLHEHRHESEDQLIDHYLDQSRTVDRVATLQAGIARGWLLLAFGGLSPSLISGTKSQVTIALSVGGILLAYRALTKLIPSLSSLTGVAIAWRQIAPFFHAAARPERGASVTSLHIDSYDSDGRRPLLEGCDLVFRYTERSEPVLRGCSLKIHAGEKILLKGPSGEGKSTLTSLLTGIRSPESGVLLLHGLDLQSIGPIAWRRRIAAAPQFHENHVLAETFAFNLLMGRGWPPEPIDLQEAEDICRDLGLGDLLERMPGGLMQMVGETGWQLSHGERSRLFVARALLQNAEIVVLDESFAALDPEHLHQCLECVRARSNTLLVNAHS